MADISTLTERQREIYGFIRDQIENKGWPPTIRDIGNHFAIKSPNGVMCHLKALEKKGLIQRDKKAARAITLVDRLPRRTPSTLPFLGLVAAGAPLAAEKQDEKLDLGELFTGPDHYVLKVQGRSMIDSNIQDGDYVVIRKREDASNGERVVAQVEGEVTLKRFYRRKDHIVLQPENGEMAPIVVAPDKNVSILGVLVGVLRRC
jgi:repressor LexA